MKRVSRYLRRISRKIYKSVGSVSINQCTLISRKEIFASHTLDIPTRTDIDGNPNQYFMGYQVLVPASYLYSAENSRLINGREELFTSNYEVYDELTSALFNHGKHLCEHDFGKEMRLNGSVLSLSLSGLEKNYYHFLVEFLARWWLFKQSGVDVDWIIFPMEMPFHAQFIEILGIDPCKIVTWKEYGSLIAEKVIYPSLINNQRFVPYASSQLNWRKEWIPKWLSDLYPWIRDRVVNSSAPLYMDCSRIYVSRSKALIRRILNEVELTSALANLDFLIVDLAEFDVSQQISMFSGAKMVIAPHGAGLANLFFCQPGVSVLELHADTSYQDPSYWLSSCLMGHDFSYAIGEPLMSSSDNPKDRDFIVNVNRVVEWVRSRD